MRYGRYLALIVLVGFSLSFQGRYESDVESSRTSSALRVFERAHEHEDSSRVPCAPMGDHTDRHGCYHSHAPFVTVTIAFKWLATATALASATLNIPYSHAETNILHPPRV
jgi:hypothetical protein